MRRERYQPFNRGILDGHLIEIGAKLGAKLIFGRVVRKESCDEITQSVVLRPDRSASQAAYRGACDPTLFPLKSLPDGRLPLPQQRGNLRLNIGAQETGARGRQV